MQVVDALLYSAVCLLPKSHTEEKLCWLTAKKFYLYGLPIRLSLSFVQHKISHGFKGFWYYFLFMQNVISVPCWHQKEYKGYGANNYKVMGLIHDHSVKGWDLILVCVPSNSEYFVILCDFFFQWSLYSGLWLILQDPFFCWITLCLWIICNLSFCGEALKIKFSLERVQFLAVLIILIALCTWCEKYLQTSFEAAR